MEETIALFVMEETLALTHPSHCFQCLLRKDIFYWKRNRKENGFMVKPDPKLIKILETESVPHLFLEWERRCCLCKTYFSYEHTTTMSWASEHWPDLSTLCLINSRRLVEMCMTCAEMVFLFHIKNNGLLDTKMWKYVH